jgi:hypothetical protein
VISIRQQTLGLIAAAALAGVAMGSALAAPVPVAPAAQAFSVGQFKLFALRDMQNVLPNDGKVFGKDVGPEKVADVLKTADQPTDKITLDVDALLVQTPDHVVLLDTGLGPKVGGVLMQSLGKTGIQPDQVTDILITHAHGDHVGGLVTADGKPAFPHAAIHMSATEWRWMQSMPNFKPMIDAIGPSVKKHRAPRRCRRSARPARPPTAERDWSRSGSRPVPSREADPRWRARGDRAGYCRCRCPSVRSPRIAAPRSAA